MKSGAVWPTQSAMQEGSHEVNVLFPQLNVCVLQKYSLRTLSLRLLYITFGLL